MWMGCDTSWVAENGSCGVDKLGKVWHDNGWLIGGAGMQGIIQGIRYSYEMPDPISDDASALGKQIMHDILPSMRLMLEDHHSITGNPSGDDGVPSLVATIMLAVRGHLFTCYGLSTISLESSDRYACIGSGSPVARGALYVMNRIDGTPYGINSGKKLVIAMMAAARYEDGVNKSFHIHMLDKDGNHSMSEIDMESHGDEDV